MLKTSWLLALLAPFAAAQTFVVDAANGPGTHFTDLPTAVAAVPDGATLVLRAGAYGPIVLQGKGLTVVGGAGVMLNGILSPAVDVRGLAAHQSFALRGAAMGWALQGPAQVSFTNNAGRVLLEEFRFDYRTSPYLGSFGAALPGAIVAVNCAQVVLRRCTIVGSNAVSATGSAVDLDSCALQGSGSTTVVYHNPVHAGSPALYLQGSEVRVASCSLQGGPGALPNAMPSPAIVATQSSVQLGGTTSVRGGQPFVTAGPVAAVQGSGALVRDPLVSLATSGGAPIFAGSITDSVQPWPAVVSTGGRLGQPMTATVEGAYGELCLLCVSLPGAPSSVPGVAGSVWLDSARLQLVALGTQAAATRVTFTAMMPSATVLVGRPRAWQAVSWGPVHGLQASNASLQILLP